MLLQFNQLFVCFHVYVEQFCSLKIHVRLATVREDNLNFSTKDLVTKTSLYSPSKQLIHQVWTVL